MNPSNKRYITKDIKKIPTLVDVYMLTNETVVFVNHQTEEIHILMYYTYSHKKGGVWYELEYDFLNGLFFRLYTVKHVPKKPSVYQLYKLIKRLEE